jgi:hypothetical protein
MATSKFKIKVGKIKKEGNYSFDNYVISEFERESRLNPVTEFLPRLGQAPIDLNGSAPYFEQLPAKPLRGDDTYIANLADSIFPSNGTVAEKYNEIAKEEQKMKTNAYLRDALSRLNTFLPNNENAQNILRSIGLGL